MRYDQWGYRIPDTPVKQEDDFRQFLEKENDDAGFQFFAANEEQLEKALAMQSEPVFKGGRKDVDKNLAEMTEEERAVFDCLEDEKNVFDGNYDALDDDFIMMLNDGKPALEQFKDLQRPPILDPDHENAGV